MQHACEVVGSINPHQGLSLVLTCRVHSSKPWLRRNVIDHILSYSIWRHMPLGRRKEIYQDGLISRYYVSHRLRGRQFLFSSFDLFSHCMWCAIWGVGLHQDGARKYVSRDSLQRDQSIWDSEDAGCNWKGGWDAPWRDKEDGGGGTSLWSSLHVEVQGRWKSHKQVPSRPTLRVVSRCRWCGTQFKELREGLRFFYFLKGDFEPLTGE